ncbi:hypothetical protein B0H63DRAFT_499788 [Podospora didyma]|uniref:TauD/TfdA-like domain-containing protein n=1 Tax=Podospora didyma TaxID=330526 RepID=A0AAE0NYG9_9PEZI|nr:hypothetical protein B0H63DRAFT_499788 [Podospora didyma]
MPYIRNGNDAALLQLQYLAESIGLNRGYLDERDDEESLSLGIDEQDITSPDPGTLSSCLIRPIPTKGVVKAAIKRPDIEWHPSYETCQARVAALEATAQNRPSSVPEGFPDQISSPRVWTGSDFADREKHLVHLSNDDIEEIGVPLDFFKNLDGDHGPDAVTTKNFPLPNLRKRLKEVANNIHLGTGFNVIRGLSTVEFSPLVNILIYLGITSYIAEIRGVQDYDGRMISSGRPPPYANRAQDLQRDRSHRPDIIHVLADDMWTHDEWHCKPLLFNFPTHGPSFCYSHQPLTGAPFSAHHPGVPAMTEAQAEAIDAFQFIAAKHQLAITLEAGDIEIFNNMALFHARNAFEDNNLDEDDARDMRHMAHMWLRSADAELAWQTPGPLELNAAKIYGDGGARKMARWDVHRPPPINRVLIKHFDWS